MESHPTDSAAPLGESAGARGAPRSTIALEATLLGLAALAVFVLLGQRMLNSDATAFLYLVREGRLENANHPFYLPLLRATSAAAGWFGLTLFESARLASELSAALGVALVCAACRLLGLSRGDSLLVAAGSALCPSVLFFATQVEIQAPFLATVGIATLAMAWLAREPSFSRAALLGACTGLAACVHAAGLLLPWPLLVWWFTLAAAGQCRAVGRGRALRLAVVTVLVHGALVLAVSGAGDAAGEPAGLAHVVAFVARWSRDTLANPGLVPLVTWREWVWPYLPFSVLWLASFGTRQRFVGAAFLVALAPFLAVTCLMLGSVVEHGAYLQCLVPFACWIAARTLPRGALVAAVALTALLGVQTVARAPGARRVDRYVAGVRAVSAGREPLLLVGDTVDLEACFVGLPSVPFVHVAKFAVDPDREAALATLDRMIAAKREAQEPVLLTGGAVRTLVEKEYREEVPALVEVARHLRTRYRLVATQVEDFQASELFLKR